MTAKLLVALGAGIVGLGVLAAQNAICLNACEGRHWSRVHVLAVPLDIDWGWEWVGEGAETATITVKGLRSGAIHEFSLAKPDTAATLELGAVTPQTEDAYEATVVFRNAAGEETGRRTARFEALAGSFGAVPLTADAEDRDWRRSRTSVALVGYDREWFDDSGPVSLSVSSAAGVRQTELQSASGIETVKDWGPAELRLLGGDGGTLAEAFVNFAQGLLLMIQ